MRDKGLDLCTILYINLQFLSINLLYFFSFSPYKRSKPNICLIKKTHLVMFHIVSLQVISFRSLSSLIKNEHLLSLHLQSRQHTRECSLGNSGLAGHWWPPVDKHIIKSQEEFNSAAPFWAQTKGTTSITGWGNKTGWFTQEKQIFVFLWVCYQLPKTVRLRQKLF